VLGVSPDRPAALRAFADKYGLVHPLLSDPDRTVLTAYGAFGERIRDGKPVTGVIRSTVWIAPDGTVRRRWAPVSDAAAHPADVLAALRGQ
jgi:peroxiredoxin Q/BCP